MARKNSKRRLTSAEEFEIMKLVLDKFLWIGTIVMLWGLYVAFSGSVNDGAYYMIAGAVVLILFAIFIVKEFERIR